MQQRTRLIKRKDLLSEKVRDKTFIISPKQNEFVYELNSTGTFVWELINGKTPISGIIKKFREHFNISEKKADDEVTAFLSALKEAKLIRIK